MDNTIIKPSELIIVNAHASRKIHSRFLRFECAESLKTTWRKNNIQNPSARAGFPFKTRRQDDTQAVCEERTILRARVDGFNMCVRCGCGSRRSDGTCSIIAAGSGCLFDFDHDSGDVLVRCGPCVTETIAYTVDCVHTHTHKHPTLNKCASASQTTFPARRHIAPHKQHIVHIYGMYVCSVEKQQSVIPAQLFGVFIDRGACAQSRTRTQRLLGSLRDHRTILPR